MTARWQKLAMAACISLGSITALGGCVYHHHHDDGLHAQIDIVDEHGWRHHGYYDEHHSWHGGYTDEHGGYHDDAPDWHH